MHHLGRGSALESVHQSFAGAGLVEHLQALGVEYQIWIAPLVYALRKFLLCWIEAVELIKTNILRTHAFRFTNMPLAGKHGLVANRSKNRGQGSLIGPRVLGEFVASKNRACQPRANRQATGQDRRARWRAGRLRVARGEFQSALCQRINIRCRRANSRATAEATRISVPHVIDNHPHNVWLLARCALPRSQACRYRLVLFCMRDRGLHGC